MVIFTNCELLSNSLRGWWVLTLTFHECLGAQVTVLALILLLPSLRYDLCNPVSMLQWSQELCLRCLGEHRWCYQFMEWVSVPETWVLVVFKVLFSFTVWVIHILRCSTVWGPWKGSSFQVQIKAMRPQKYVGVKFGEGHEGDVEWWSSGPASKEKSLTHVVVEKHHSLLLPDTKSGCVPAVLEVRPGTENPRVVRAGRHPWRSTAG